MTEHGDQTTFLGSDLLIHFQQQTPFAPEILTKYEHIFLKAETTDYSATQNLFC